MDLLLAAYLWTLHRPEGLTRPFAVAAPVDLARAPMQVDGWDVRLQGVDDPVHGQLVRLGPWGAAICFIAPPGAGDVEIGASQAPPAPAAFAFADDGAKHLTLTEAGRPVLVYNYADLLPEGVPEDRRRQAYVHPVYGPDGEVLTDDFPPDHFHHRGLYAAWPGVRVGETDTDLWHLRGIERRFEGFAGQVAGPVVAVFGVKTGWFVGDRRVMDEVTWYRVWRSDAIGRRIDVHHTWTAQGTPITLHPKDAKGYGGFLLRLAPRQAPRLATAAGPQAGDTDLVPTPWADYTGQFAGAPGRSGIAILQHPQNPGYPAGWCLRNYGFLGVSWPGNGEFTFQPETPVTALFRVVTHRGGAESVAEEWGAWEAVRVEARAVP